MVLGARTADFDGVAEALRALPAALRKKVLLAAGGAAIKVLRDEVARRAPVGTQARRGTRAGKAGGDWSARRPGTLRRSIRIRRPKSTDPSEIVLGIGFSRLAYYWRWVEHGTRAHSIGKGRHPGARPRPFLGPAAEARRAEVLSLLTVATVNTVRAVQAELARRAEGPR